MSLLVPVQVGLLAYGAYQQNKAHKAQKKSNIEAAKERILAARQVRVQAVRERMQAQAVLNVQSATQGTAGSSGVIGAQSSVASQSGAALAFGSATDMFGRARAGFQDKAQKAEYRSEVAASLLNFSFSDPGKAALARIGLR